MRVDDLPNLAAVTAVARRAGERIMAVYGQAQVDRVLKPDRSPVTAADLAAQTEIAQGLEALSPGVPQVSEEALPLDPAAVVRDAPHCWLVDPLDGTRDFLARTGEFTVNIALMCKGRPVLGCVFAPASDAMYVAARGQGAFRQARDGTMCKIATRRPPSALMALLSGQHRFGEDERLRRALPGVQTQHVGSSLKYVVIAAGGADFSMRLTPTSLWDTAAAQCVLEQAGGAMLDFDGRTLVYTRGVVENPPFVAVGMRELFATLSGASGLL